MNAYKIRPHGFASNTYAVTEDGKECILIDCAQPSVLDECARLSLTPRAVLLTHGHYDHIGGCKTLRQSGADIYCGEREKDFIFSEDNAAIFSLPLPVFDIAHTLRDNEELSLCGLNIKVLYTPGHSVGSVCYLIGDSLFTGDTLFYGSVGRWDLPTGSYRSLENSVKRLYALKGNYKVFCGHGEDTVLSDERQFNAVIRA